MLAYVGIFFYLAGSLISWYFFSKPIAILSMLYLGFGDPIASAFGIAFSTPWLRASNGKSLLGTLAATVVCTLITMACFNNPLILECGPVSNPLQWPEYVRWSVAIAGGVAAGVAELSMFGMVRDYLDDNAIIPVVSSLVLYLTTEALGHSL